MQEEPGAAPSGPGLVERYRVRQKAGGLVAPLLTLLLAFLISGVVVLATTGSFADTGKTYRAIFRGAGLNWFFEVGHHAVGLPFRTRASGSHGTPTTSRRRRPRTSSRR